MKDCFDWGRNQNREAIESRNNEITNMPTNIRLLFGIFEVYELVK